MAKRPGIRGVLTRSTMCTSSPDTPDYTHAMLGLRTYEEVKVGDAVVFPDQGGCEAQLGVCVDDPDDSPEHGSWHHMHLMHDITCSRF